MIDYNPVDIHETIDKNRGRIETRKTEVYDNLQNIPPVWHGLKTIIRVSRKVVRKNKETEEIAYFISSLSTDTKASVFNRGIRSHWAIENSLHYVKDKTFKEDSSKIKTGNSPENFTVFRNITLNIFRYHGLQNMASAIRLHSDDIKKLWELILA